MENTKFIIIGAISIVTYCISRPILRDKMGLDSRLLPIAVSGLCFLSLSSYAGSGCVIIHLYGALGLTFVACILIRLLVGVFAPSKASQWFTSDTAEDSSYEPESDKEDLDAERSSQQKHQRRKDTRHEDHNKNR